MRSVLALIALSALVVAAVGRVGAVGKITQDPNVGGTVREQSVKKDPLELDKRLDRKVTYWAANEPVSSVLSCLGRLAGVKLSCGVNNDDWQVRDRKMNVFATGVPLRDLMRSIARVMKFRWSVNDEKTPWTYRLYMVRTELLEAQALLRKQEEEYERRMAGKRKEFADKYMAADSMSPADLQKLKQTDPEFYLDVTYGIASPFAALLGEVPQFHDAFLSGDHFELNGSKLSPAAQQALLAMAHGIANRSEMEKNIGGDSSGWKIPDGFDTQVNNLRISFTALKKVDDLAILPGYLLGEVDIGTDEPEKHWVNDLAAFFPFGIYDSQCDYKKIQSKLEVDALDQNKTVNEVCTPNYSSDMDAAAAKLKHALPGERLIEHAQDNTPLDRVKIKPKSERLADVEQALVDASSLAVVSDNFGRSTASEGGIPSEEVTVREALEKIGTAYNYNWDMHARVIEFRDRQWFKKRSLQLPEAWLERWRKTYKETGTLDLDDLAQIAKLDLEQKRANLDDDKILGDMALRRATVLDYASLKLKAYALLNDDQRAALFTEGGLDLAVFCADPKVEREVTQPMREWFRNNRSPRTCKGKTLYGTRVKVDKHYEYTFRAVADDPSLEPIEWKITTPEYKEPKPPEKKAK